MHLQHASACLAGPVRLRGTDMGLPWLALFGMAPVCSCCDLLLKAPLLERYLSYTLQYDGEQGEGGFHGSSAAGRDPLEIWPTSRRGKLYSLEVRSHLLAHSPMHAP